MKSKPNNKLSLKEYIFLAICLLIFFLAGLYLNFGGTIPTDNTLVFASLGAVIIAIPIVLYVLKKLNDGQE